MSDTEFAWVAPLADRYARVLEEQQQPDVELQHRLPGLQLASASLACAQMYRKHGNIPTQIAVMGPTQSGKSTLVNCILDSLAAAVSPLAGFTVHAQGYTASLKPDDKAALQALMQPLQLTPAQSLRNTNLDAFVLEEITAGDNALTSDSVVWDTPDFDSIDARSYASAVLKVAALADLIILVVSKDKYGDQRVWDMLELLHALSRPLIVCINKLNDRDQQIVSHAFTQKHQETFSSVPDDLILIPYQRHTQETDVHPIPESVSSSLRTRIADRLPLIDRTQRSDACAAFISRREKDWLSPVLKEHEAALIWRDMITAVIADTDEHYASEYLENPDQYDTFNRTLAELLTLLEVPGVASALSRTRQLVTWPARRLLGVGKAAWNERFSDEAGGDQASNQEARVMQHLFDRSMIQLQARLLEQPANPWWRTLDKSFREQAPLLKMHFARASEQCRSAFDPQIDAAARELFEQLQSQPKLLNSLRAARVTADAAGVALAVKSGGLAPADLVLAPAMLSVTTLLTEGALGSYINRIKKKLKQRQRQHVMEILWQGFLEKQLLEIPGSADNKALFSTALEPALRLKLETMI